MAGEEAARQATRAWRGLELGDASVRQMAVGLHRTGSEGSNHHGWSPRPANDYLSYRLNSRERDMEIWEEVIAGEHIESRSTHGTGCAFATSLACRLALGESLPQAARGGKRVCPASYRQRISAREGHGAVESSGVNRSRSSPFARRLEQRTQRAGSYRRVAGPSTAARKGSAPPLRMTTAIHGDGRNSG